MPQNSGMMPGGHLATSLVLSGAAYVTTGSIEAAAGCFAGGFLIDVDHYFDYVVFEKQWRRPGPVSFLRYYFTHSPKKLVLPLHSAELMTVLFLIMLTYRWPLLVGYCVGAAMHLIFDVLVNGEYALKRALDKLDAHGTRATPLARAPGDSHAHPGHRGRAGSAECASPRAAGARF